MFFNDFLLNFDSFKTKLKKLPDYLKEEPSINSILKKNRFRIVLVGGVGVGKSSLLERLLEVKMPKGNNCCTRRPVIISSTDKSIIDDAAVGVISKDPIVYDNTSNSSNFEFIDLPGLTSMSRPDQPETYPQFTRELLDIYTPTADIIILCLPVDADLVNSDALKYMKSLEIDDRVICVLSKIDLLEEGEGELSALQLEITKTFSGVVAVRNAPLLEMSESIRSTNQKEEDFFSNRLGGNFGVKSVKNEIIKVAQAIFDRMKREISVRLWKEKVRLERRLVSLTDPNFSLKMLSDYIDHATSITSSLTSDYEEGSRIGYVFWKSLPEALDSIDPLNGIDRNQLAILMKNAQGLKAGFQFESAFKTLLKTQLKASETAIWDCLNMILKEFREFLLVPVDEIEENDQEEEEFYDVKSVSDSDLEDETGFKNMRDSSLKGQLCLLPDLPRFINKTVLGILEDSYQKTKKYLDEYCAMQKETVFCSEAAYFEAFKQYEKTRETGDQSGRSTPTLTSKLHSSSDDLPLKRIQSESLEALASKAPEESSFLKEFLALLFPTISDVKRVEYRPRKRITRKTAQCRTDFEPIVMSEKRDEDLLLILLEIYLKSYHRQLTDFLPKCINYHLIGGTLRGLPSVLYQNWRGSREGEREEAKRIERVLRVIEEINLNT